MKAYALIVQLLLVAACTSETTPKVFTSEVPRDIQDLWTPESGVRDAALASFVQMIADVECKKSDAQLGGEQLSSSDITFVRDFCRKSPEEMAQVFRQRFDALQVQIAQPGAQQPEPQILEFNNSYNCWTGDYNIGIPTYGDLGLSEASCSWHDPKPECRVMGKVACLWGCTNHDPNLG